MQVDLNVDEMRLSILALARLRHEIDVDGPNKMQTMNEGQRQACRYTIVAVDALSLKLNIKFKEALDGVGTNT